MKKILMLATVLILLAGSTGAAATQGILTVVQEKFLVLPYENYYEGNVYAEVKNTGDKPVQFNGGLFELFDAAGNSIGSQELLYYDCNPEVLLPGETGFVYSTIAVEDAGEESYIADHALTLLGTGNITTSVMRYSATAYFQEGTDEFASSRYAAAIVGNETDEILRDFFAGFALKDVNGELLYVTSGTWASSGIVGHSLMEVRLRVDENVVDYWNSKGIVPASAEAIVFKTSPK